ncbi:alpha/beta fold hydrolase [Pseudoalteromonas fenneropenaei]|uniref:Alpha/beta fold hydrolase n=1 Tax=Pseudoalteromonas fenneropenaei TaxID=1737459 RepID=A0ABV7CJH3_9GAMM
MIEDLIEFVNKDLLEGAAPDLDQHTPLLELGILNSLSMVRLLAYIDQQYGAKIPEHDITPVHFENLETLALLIKSLSGEVATEESNVSELDRLVKLQESYGIQSELVDAGVGFKQHVLRVKGTGPLWILLPALGNPSTSWSAILRSVQGRHNAIALDLAGFGLSKSENPSPTFVDHVEYTLQYLQTLQEQEWVLVANSAGSMIAAEVARRFPEKVKGLVCTGFGLIEDVDSWWMDLQKMSHDPEQFLAAAYYNPPKMTPALKSLLDDVLSRPAYHEFLDHQAKSSMAKIFDGISVPTLFIAGNHDQIIPPEWSEKAAAKLPNAQVTRLSRCGHFSASERPEEFVWVVEDFLTKAAMA